MRTVFLSHCRNEFGKHFARLSHQTLKHEGYDVFLDVETIEAGKWEAHIPAAVEMRAHFLLLLTPGCFDGCDSPDDWVRREFEPVAGMGGAPSRGDPATPSALHAVGL